MIIKEITKLKRCAVSVHFLFTFITYLEEVFFITN